MFSVTTKSKQNTTIIETDDSYEYQKHFEMIAERFTFTQLDVLDSFDVRLAKLEKSILPLYTATQILNRRKSSE